MGDIRVKEKISTQSVCNGKKNLFFRSQFLLFKKKLCPNYELIFQCLSRNFLFSLLIGQSTSAFYSHFIFVLSPNIKEKTNQKSKLQLFFLSQVHIKGKFLCRYSFIIYTFSPTCFFRFHRTCSRGYKKIGSSKREK